MDTLTAIHTRRSIRKYTDQPVTPEQVRTLLAAAMAAPSAGNQQPWQFVVVTDKDLLAQVGLLHPHVHMAPKAPLGILVCGDTRAEKYAGYWVVDCSAAVQNLLLAAHDLGLGAVWTPSPGCSTPPPGSSPTRSSPSATRRRRKSGTTASRRNESTKTASRRRRIVVNGPPGGDT